MAGVLTTVKDANGKDISIDFAKIADINGDVGPDSTAASAMDGRKNRVAQVHDVEIVDSNGQAIDRNQLLADMASGKTNVVALDVEMEATHSGPNHNYCIYYEDSMEKDCESFTNPFKKPVLKNHNSYDGEPLGRIQQAWYGPSVLTDERSAIHLKTRITDQEAFPKFLDGRYSTVSISGTMGTVTCNICGKTILKDGKFKFCGHWRGESYKDQVCYWGAKDIEYHEVSTVNNPADDFAQIMKVTVVTDENKKGEGSDMDGQSNTQQTQASNASAEEVKKSVCDMIDQLLGKPSTASSTSDSQTTTEQQTTETPAAASATDGTQATEGTPSATDANQNGDDMAQKLQKAEADLADATKKLEEVQTELQTTKDALTKANSDLEAANAELQTTKDMCLSLATANKEMVIDQILAKEKAAKTLAEDKVEERKNELLAQSMKDLNKMLSDSTAAPAARTPATVQNPTIADTSKDGGSTGANGTTADSDNANKSAKRTVDDFAKDIVGKLFK